MMAMIMMMRGVSSEERVSPAWPCPHSYCLSEFLDGGGGG